MPRNKLTRKDFRFIADRIAHESDRSARIILFNFMTNLLRNYNRSFDSDKFEEACKLEG